MKLQPRHRGCNRIQQCCLQFVPLGRTAVSVGGTTATYPTVPKVGDVQSVVYGQDTRGGGPIFPGRLVLIKLTKLMYCPGCQAILQSGDGLLSVKFREDKREGDLENSDAEHCQDDAVCWLKGRPQSTAPSALSTLGSYPC